jgi:hypothetical protein
MMISFGLAVVVVGKRSNVVCKMFRKGGGVLISKDCNCAGKQDNNQLDARS